MIVFKNYFKLVKSYLPFIILYTVIFIFFAVFASTNDSSTKDFSGFKPKVAFINRDGNTLLLQNFEKYLNENSKIIDIIDEEEKLKDALFAREVDYIIIVNEGFTEDFISDKNPKMNTMSTPDSSSIYVEMLLNKYLKIANMYALSGMNEKEIIKNVNIDIEKEVNVIINSNVDTGMLAKAKFFFNFANYTFLAICIMIVGMILGSYNNIIIKRRNIISAKRYSSINLELFLGNLLIMIFIWLFYVLLSIILYGNAMFTINGLLLIINSFIFGILALSIGFLIGNIIINKEVSSAITNVVALGSSFLCGAFVPQELLGESVLSFARIIPSYWYIKNNEIISALTIFDWKSISPIIINMFILIGYALIFFIITNIINKKRIKDN